MTGAFAVSDALNGRSTSVITVVTVEAWLVWAMAWLAILVPRTVSLTVARVLLPTALIAAIVSAGAGADVGWGVAFIVAALCTTTSLQHGQAIDAFVDGSSYGPERRFALRTPPLLAISAVPLTWLGATIGLAVPVLVAAEAWVPAAVLAVVALVVTRPSIRSLHVLSSRWIVFVPAGMVLHDPLHLIDAILIPRRAIEALGPAMADTDAVDLTGGTFGLTLQFDVERPLGVGQRQGRNQEPREITANRFLFAVIRPGALLEDAQSRRFHVGATAPHTPELSGCSSHDTPVATQHAPIESQTAVPLPRTRSSR